MATLRNATRQTSPFRLLGTRSLLGHRPESLRLRIKVKDGTVYLWSCRKLQPRAEALEISPLSWTQHGYLRFSTQTQVPVLE